MQRVTEIINCEIERCIPANPVCLSWLNKSGGWDTYVFGVTQSLGVDTSIGVITNMANEELSTANSSSRAHGRRSFPKMILGVEGISTQRMLGIEGLLEAALTLYMVEWVQPAAPVWLEVIVEPGSFKTRETGENKHFVEFTIAFPERNVQQT